jgi:hypothetical protein
MKYFFVSLLCTPLFAWAMVTSHEPVVALGLSGGTEVGFVRVSNSESFLTFKEFPYDSQKPIINWDICYPKQTCSFGNKMVFVEYLDHQKRILATVSQVVNYRSNTLPTIPQQNNPKQVISPLDIPVEPAIETFEPKQITPESNTIVPGCTDSKAVNFFKDANQDNGSCVFPPVVKTSPTVGLTSGLIIGGLQTIFLFTGYGMRVAEIPLLVSRFFSQLLFFIGARKKPKQWGTVIDSVSGQGLDPVVVSLFDQSNNEVKNAITDIGGRFGFLVPAGTYRLTAQKTHYQFPSENGYHGEWFSITTDQIVNIDIPLQPIQPDWNEEEKKKYHLSRWELYRKQIALLFSILFFVSFGYTLFVFTEQPSLVHGLFVIINFIFLILRTIGFMSKPFGIVYDKINKKPLEQAVLKFSFTQTPSIVIKKITTDFFGRYYGLLSAGDYVVTVVDKSNTIIATDHVSVRSHIFKKDFAIKKP